MKSISQLRRCRVEGVALFDLTLTFFIAWIFQNLFVKKLKWFGCPRSYYCAIIPIAVLVHVLMGQPTAFNKGLFSDKINWQKIIFAVLLIGTIAGC